MGTDSKFLVLGEEKEKVGLVGHSPLNENEKNARFKEEVMITEDEFGAVQALKQEGYKKKQVAQILGMDRKTVRKYWKLGKRKSYQRQKAKPTVIDPYRDYLSKRAPETNYNAWVCFKDIEAKGYPGKYEQVKRFIRPLRDDRDRLLEATLRFETAPGKQAQVDWGSTRVVISGKPTRVHLFAKVLGYSRRIYVRAEDDEALPTLISCHERAFEWFGGVTETILYDNPKTICLSRDFEGRHITWNPQFLDFARYRGFRIDLCKPYRARTKGKIESGIKYVKQNFFAIHGRSFTSLEDLNQKLEAWCLQVADERIHGTTHEKPSTRFAHERLQPTAAKPPYVIELEITRRVPSDALVVHKTNRYSVPWRYVGKQVTLKEGGERLKIYCAGDEIADHSLLGGKHQKSILSGHYEGILKASLPKQELSPAAQVSLWRHDTEEVEERGLEHYEALLVLGGAS